MHSSGHNWGLLWDYGSFEKLDVEEESLSWVTKDAESQKNEGGGSFRVQGWRWVEI